MFEVETKVLDIDPEDLKKRLDDLGAEKILETRLIVDWYKNPKDNIGSEPWFLRVRSYSDGKHEVTWKARSEILGNSRKHKEINFEVSNAASAADLFNELGLEAYAHQEKDRLSWKLEDWRFDLDKYPNMPPYLEIEGISEDHINKAIGLLGLEKNKTSPQGERILIETEYKLNWYDMRFK